jgi:hypothetical protein
MRRKSQKSPQTSPSSKPLPLPFVTKPVTVASRFANACGALFYTYIPFILSASPSLMRWTYRLPSAVGYHINPMGVNGGTAGMKRMVKC